MSIEARQLIVAHVGNGDIALMPHIERFVGKHGGASFVR